MPTQQNKQHPHYTPKLTPPKHPNSTHSTTPPLHPSLPPICATTPPKTHPRQICTRTHHKHQPTHRAETAVCLFKEEERKAQPPQTTTNQSLQAGQSRCCYFFGSSKNSSK